MSDQHADERARLTPQALREIARTLRGMEHPAAAERLRHLVLEAARLIGRHPEIGRREPSLADDRYRFWPVAGFSYLLVYRNDLTPPAIVRFVHMARDLPQVLARLRRAR